MSKSLIIAKGTDENNIRFTAYIVCSPEEAEQIKSLKITNLTKFKIPFLQVGHNIDPKVTSQVAEYCIVKGIMKSEEVNLIGAEHDSE